MLKGLLPTKLTTEQIQAQVLSPTLATALDSLHTLIHDGGEKGNSSLLKDVIPVVGNQLAEMQIFFKPLQRVPTMTQFKKILHLAHQVVSARALDAQMTELVSKVEMELNDLLERDQHLAQCCERGELKFEGVSEMLRVSLGLKTSAAQLPQTDSSEHFQLGQNALKAVAEDCWLLLLQLLFFDFPLLMSHAARVCHRVMGHGHGHGMGWSFSHFRPS